MGRWARQGAGRVHASPPPRHVALHVVWVSTHLRLQLGWNHSPGRHLDLYGGRLLAPVFQVPHGHHPGRLIWVQVDVDGESRPGDIIDGLSIRLLRSQVGGEVVGRAEHYHWQHRNPCHATVRGGATTGRRRPCVVVHYHHQRRQLPTSVDPTLQLQRLVRTCMLSAMPHHSAAAGSRAVCSGAPGHLLPPLRPHTGWALAAQGRTANRRGILRQGWGAAAFDGHAGCAVHRPKPPAVCTLAMASMTSLAASCNSMTCRIATGRVREGAGSAPGPIDEHGAGTPGGR